MSDPTFRPAPSVPRSPIDDYYTPSQPSPYVSKDVGTVVSIEGDTATVDIDGELISGIVLLNGEVGEGDDIQIEKRNDLWVTYDTKDNQINAPVAGNAIVSDSTPSSEPVTNVNLGGSMRDSDMWFQPGAERWDEDWAEAEVALTQVNESDWTLVLASTEVFDVQPGDVIYAGGEYRRVSSPPQTARVMLYVSSKGEDESAVLPGDPYTVEIEVVADPATDFNFRTLFDNITIPSTITLSGAPQTLRVNECQAPRSEAGIAPWATDPNVTLKAGAEGWYTISGNGLASLVVDIPEDGDYRVQIEGRNVGDVTVDYFGQEASALGSLVGGTFTLTAGSHGFGFQANSSSGEFRNILIEKVSTTEDTYFDGSFPGHEWVGAQWASKSRRPALSAAPNPEVPVAARVAFTVATSIETTAAKTILRDMGAAVQRSNMPEGALWYQPSTGSLKIWHNLTWQTII